MGRDSMIYVVCTHTRGPWCAECATANDKVKTTRAA